MVFSDTTNKNGLIQRCEDYAGFADGGISSDTTTLRKFAANINESIYDLQTEIMSCQDEVDFDDQNYSDYPIGTFALTTNRDYVIPASLNFLKLKRLDVSYDGTTWYRATPIDSSQLEALGNATNEDQNFSFTDPRYDVKGNSIWLYPKATSAQVAAGALARIEFIREFDEFTSADTTQEPPIDRPFRDLICIGATLKWAVMKDADKAKNLKVLYDEGVEKLRNHYGRKNLDSQLIMDPYIPSYK